MLDIARLHIPDECLRTPVERTIVYPAGNRGGTISIAATLGTCPP
jgi:hypothetical protein